MNTQKHPGISFNRDCPCKEMGVSTADQFDFVKYNRGFTLVELIVVCGILGVLVTLTVPSYNLLVNKAKIARCVAEIRGMEKDINAYFIDKGVLPSSLNDIGKNNFLDPWKKPYEYINITNTPGTARESSMTVKYNEDFDLYSLGPDGDSAQVYSDLDGSSTKDDIIRTGDGGYVGLRDF